MAESYGVKGKRIHSSEEVKETIQKAIELNEPYLIEGRDRSGCADLFLSRNYPRIPGSMG